MRLIFDITLCGDWASAVYPGGAGKCIDNVVSNPRAFDSSYWTIEYVLVFGLSAPAMRDRAGAGAILLMARWGSRRL